MDIGGALGFVFEDERWVAKLALGSLILLIPIFGVFAMIGYLIGVIRNVMNGLPRPLPEWDDLGQKFVDGLLVWVAMLIYSLPMLILICPVVLVWFLPLLGGEQDELVRALSGLSMAVAVGVGCLAVLYSLLLAMVTPPVYLQYAGHGSLGACLRIGDVFRFAFRNLGSIVLFWVVYWVASLAVSLVFGLIGAVVAWIPCVGWVISMMMVLAWLPVAVWLMAFQGHLIGQIGQSAGLPTPVS